MADQPYKDDTVIGHAGNDPAGNHGIVNPPVYHASTLLFPTLAALEDSVRHLNGPGRVHYGRCGTPITFAPERAVAQARVLRPALPSDPGHHLRMWDFIGASGLFGIVLHPVPKAALAVARRAGQDQ